jgi:hypothetical protein
LDLTYDETLDHYVIQIHKNQVWNETLDHYVIQIHKNQVWNETFLYYPIVPSARLHFNLMAIVSWVV